jgi:hypothetical protein
MQQPPPPEPPPPEPPPPEPPPQPSLPQQRPWGYEPPRPPQPPRPWYRQPLGIFGIVTAALLAVGLLANALGGGQAPGAAAPATTAAPGAAVPPTAAATTTTVPATLGDRIRQTAQDELGTVGTVAGVDAQLGGTVTVTWEIAPAATMGLTRNQARLGALRIMRAVKQAEAGAGDDYQGVRLLGRYRPPGSAQPTTVVRLRFSKATVQRTDFSDLRYAEAYDLADTAIVDPAFRG